MADALYWRMLAERKLVEQEKQHQKDLAHTTHFTNITIQAILYYILIEKHGWNKDDIELLISELTEFTTANSDGIYGLDVYQLKEKLDEAGVGYNFEELWKDAGIDVPEAHGGMAQVNTNVE